MYKEIPHRTKLVIEWDKHIAAGGDYDITNVGRLFRAAMIPVWKSQSGYGGQTIARILVDHCGWERSCRRICKPFDSI